MTSVDDTLSQPVQRGLALVVDDERANRLLLTTLLKRYGYQTVEAENGEQAVALCKRQPPDIVFMDIMMPVMDGYQTTVEIKRRFSDTFLPVIFLTALSDKQALIRCIEVGGDDFLVKPFNPDILRARIAAMERIRDLHRHTARMYNQLQREQEIARQVFDVAIMAHNLVSDSIHSIMQSAELFSGDVLLMARTPNQDINILLGDFTGHGLASALGALPTSEVFYAMSAKGYSIQSILEGINRKLSNLLPTGMFLAGMAVHIPTTLDYISVCNFGLPKALLQGCDDGRIRETLASTDLPLGIAPELQYSFDFQTVTVDRGETLYLYSDGLIEANNAHNEQFGHERLQRIVEANSDPVDCLRRIREELKLFCGQTKPSDDISLVAIPLTSRLFSPTEPKKTTPFTAPGPQSLFHEGDDPDQPDLQVRIELGPAQLRNQLDPVPLLMNQLAEIEGIESRHSLLFTLITELYINALDHGLLRLDSSLKDHEDGFRNYHRVRQQQLAKLTSGWVSLQASIKTRESAIQITVEVEDSGPGFDYRKYQDSRAAAENLSASGRGIFLATQIAECLEFVDPGNLVRAYLSW